MSIVKTSLLDEFTGFCWHGYNPTIARGIGLRPMWNRARRQPDRFVYHTANPVYRLDLSRDHLAAIAHWAMVSRSWRLHDIIEQDEHQNEHARASFLLQSERHILAWSWQEAQPTRGILRPFREVRTRRAQLEPTLCNLKHLPRTASRIPMRGTFDLSRYLRPVSNRRGTLRNSSSYCLTAQSLHYLFSIPLHRRSISPPHKTADCPQRRPSRLSRSAFFSWPVGAPNVEENSAHTRIRWSIARFRADPGRYPLQTYEPRCEGRLHPRQVSPS